MLAAAWACLAAAIALAGLHQLTPDLNLRAVPAWFWYYRADAGVRTWLVRGALGGGALLVLGSVVVLSKARRPLHGAARWAKEAELLGAGLRDKTGLILGRMRGRYLVFGGPEHAIVYAPTRTGKGVGVVIPNLLNWPDSAVVLDIKKENWAATAGFRAKHGQDVFLFDPLDPYGQTARFNPLSYIRRSDRIHTLDELQKLAVILFPAEARTDPFWAEAARTGFIGIAAYVAETPELPFTFGEIYRQLTRGSARERFPKLMAERAASSAPLSPGCSSALSDFCGSSENTFASVRQTITSRLNLWLNPRVDAATSASDFDLRRLRDRRTTIYLGVTPDNMARVAPLYNLFFQQLVDLNTRELPAEDRHQVPVLLLLDEFARLGRASVIAHGFSYVAGYGLRLLPVIQSPAQLRAEYGQDLAEEIMTNCGVEVVFGPKDLKVATELSERLGFYTYKGRSSSRPAGLAAGRRSTTESDQRRALMLPQELLQMRRDQLIVLRSGIPPVRGRKLAYYRERAFSRRVLPPPELKTASVTSAVTEGGPVTGLAALAADVMEIKAAVREIRERVVVERPMTSEEASGEQPLSLDMLALALETPEGAVPVPPPGASEADVAAWMRDFVDRAAQAGPEPLEHDRD